MILSSTNPISTPMLCLVWNQRIWSHSNGNHLHTIGVATMKPACQHKHSAFTWMKCLWIAVTRMKYTLYQQRKSQKPKGLTRPWSTSLSAMQELIKDRRSSSLKTLPVYAKMVGWLSPSRSSCVQSNGITTIFSTLDTHVLKRQWMLQCTGKVCVPPSGHLQIMPD